MAGPAHAVFGFKPGAKGGTVIRKGLWPQARAGRRAAMMPAGAAGH